MITGSQGFVCSYICEEFLDYGYKVIGVDNYSKCGKISKPHNDCQNFRFYEMDITSPDFVSLCIDEKPRIIIAGAALVGGINYYGKYPYDILTTNERITANTFDAALNLHKKNLFNKIIVLSSSLVYEQSDKIPYKEDDVITAPLSTYGMQKLASEYFCYGAYQQYGLKYNIARLFNCVGIGKTNYVLSDLIDKIKTKPRPLAILGDGTQVRSFVHCKDVAKAIRLIAQNQSTNMCFNISTPEHSSILQLAQKIWIKLHGSLDDFVYTTLPSPTNNVQTSIADTSKIEKELRFTAKITLDQTIDEIL